MRVPRRDGYFAPDVADGVRLARDSVLFLVHRYEIEVEGVNLGRQILELFISFVSRPVAHCPSLVSLSKLL